MLQELGQIHSFHEGGVSSFSLTNFQIPGQTFNIAGGFGPVPALTSDGLFFVASGNLNTFRGLFRINPDGTGSLSTVADSSTLFPGLAETFSFFGAISANDNAVAFIAHSPSARGVFLYRDGALTTILDNLAPFDGRTIQSFSMSEAALSAEGLAFRVQFTDSTQAIYYTNLAAIPEPATWALMLGGAGMIMLWHRRRRRPDGGMRVFLKRTAPVG